MTDTNGLQKLAAATAARLSFFDRERLRKSFSIKKVKARISKSTTRMRVKIPSKLASFNPDLDIRSKLSQLALKLRGGSGDGIDGCYAHSLGSDSDSIVDSMSGSPSQSRQGRQDSDFEFVYIRQDKSKRKWYVSTLCKLSLSLSFYLKNWVNLNLFDVFISYQIILLYLYFPLKKFVDKTDLFTLCWKILGRCQLYQWRELK